MDNAYEWVPFYEALADKLLTYQDRRTDLFDLVKKVAIEQPLMKYLHLEREDWWRPRQYQIDPFSVMGIINRSTTNANRTMLAKELAEAFDMKVPAPTQFEGIPVLNNMNSLFNGPDELWELFHQALKSAEAGMFSDEFKKAFDDALAIKGNGLTYVTMGLYWIRPRFYMPLDGNSRTYIAAHFGIPVPGGNYNGDEYITFLNNLKNRISEQSPGLTFPEISCTACIRNDTDALGGANAPPVTDVEKRQRAAFIHWYIKRDGSPNTASTFSTAINKVRLKNGRAVFAITDFDELNSAIVDSGLGGYFESSSGDYSKMDLVFDVEPNTQRDDLKSGIRYYLEFLRSKGALEISDDVIASPNPASEQISGFPMEKNIILYGPPGTGKTYSTAQYAVAIIEEKALADIKSEEYAAVFGRFLKYKEDGMVAFTTFHQSFGYEEFIEGIRPVLAAGNENAAVQDIKYEVYDGVFKAFCNNTGMPRRVFIIDEINRGNISKIFGELITLIEPSKRIGAAEQLRVTLPYSGQSFGVPDNVYIIGTMNSADRSIALIDTALRRRFDFVEIQPDSTTLTDVLVDGIDIAAMLDILNKRITILLDREHTIGHSYLLPLRDEPTIEKLAGIFENKIIPLLQEYFYDDYEKIQLVLGDNQKPDGSTRFIVKKLDAVKLFGNADVDFPEYYEVNKSAFMRIDAYAFM